MSIPEDLRDVLSGEIKTADDAERAREAADLLAALLRIESAAARLLGQEQESNSTRATDLRGMTLHDAAEQVLDDAGVPLHVKELGMRIKARGWTHPRSSHPRPDQILFQLAARLPRYPSRFRRVGPNTFALTRWEKSSGRGRARRPRTSLFRGPGEAIGRTTGESEEPVIGGEASWRSS
jgi:hypothetical protein